MSVSTWLPAYMNALGAWFTNPSVYMYGRWDNPPSKAEGGVDMGSPGGTPVYALETGEIVGAGTFWHSANLYTPNSGNPGYDVVTERVNVPGYGPEDLYYQHIAMNPNIQTDYTGTPDGQIVHKGDLIGTIRPNVGMLEMGFNANWGGIWGASHPGPWATDPRPMLKALLQEGPPASLGGQPTVGTLAYTTGSTNAFDPTGIGAIWSSIQANLQRGMFGALGVGFVVLGAVVLTKSEGSIVNTAKTAAKVALL